MQRKGICKNIGICNHANSHKVIIVNDDNEEFVCPECGEPLEPSQEIEEDTTPKSNKRPIIIGAIGGIILIALILWLTVGGNSSDNKSSIISTDSVVTKKDSVENVSINLDSIAKAKADSIMAARAITDSITAKAIADSIKLAQADSILAASKRAKSAKSTSKSNGRVQVSKAQTQSPANGKLRLSYGSYSGDLKNGYPDGIGRLTYSSSRQINRFDSKKRMASAGDYVMGEFVRGFFVQGKHFDRNGNLIETLMIGTPVGSSYESK